MTIREWMDREGLTYRAAGARLEMTHVQLIQYVKGRSSPRMDTADRIERLTGGAVTRLDWPRETVERRTDAEMVALYGAACSRCGHGKRLHVTDGCNACCTCKVFAP